MYHVLSRLQAQDGLQLSGRQCPFHVPWLPGFHPPLLRCAPYLEPLSISVAVWQCVRDGLVLTPSCTGGDPEKLLHQAPSHPFSRVGPTHLRPNPAPVL